MSIVTFDRSTRRVDQDGRMHVDSAISKAQVRDYYGHEIPTDGLDPNTVYGILCPAEELEKAAHTFDNIPLLSKHVPISADNPRTEMIIGTVSSVRFEAPYLKASMAIWDQAYIDNVKDKSQAQLSCGYRYTLDMTPGTLDGKAYIGIMRNIVGNHVALVPKGRAGDDVVVGDTTLLRGKTMKREEALTKLAGLMTSDEVSELVASLSTTTPIVPEVIPMDENKVVNLLAEQPKVVTITQDQMDAAIAAAVEAAKAETALAVDAAKVEATKAVDALYTARKEVQHIVGDVALDSAEAVYKFALDHAKIDTEGVHPSAYKAMVGMIKSQAPVAVVSQRVAMDAAEKASLSAIPNINRLKTV